MLCKLRLHKELRCALHDVACAIDQFSFQDGSRFLFLRRGYHKKVRYELEALSLISADAHDRSSRSLIAFHGQLLCSEVAVCSITHLMVSRKEGFSVIALRCESVHQCAKHKLIRMQCSSFSHIGEEWCVHSVLVILDIISRHSDSHFKRLVLDGVVVCRKALYFSFTNPFLHSRHLSEPLIILLTCGARNRGGNLLIIGLCSIKALVVGC